MACWLSGQPFEAKPDNQHAICNHTGRLGDDGGTRRVGKTGGMKAWLIDDYTGIGGLRLGEVADPRAGGRGRWW